MPYSGPDDPKLPANVKSLPADKRSQWIQIWNRSFAACMKGGGGNCEQISFRNANGVVLSDMMTRDLEGVEVLREGTWNGVPFPIERLDQMVEAHKALRGILDPPIKLGHDDNQRLLQKDGYSAARIEEEVVVTPTGNKVLTKFPADQLLVAGAHYFTATGPLPSIRENEPGLSDTVAKMVKAVTQGARAEGSRVESLKS